MSITAVSTPVCQAGLVAGRGAGGGLVSRQPGALVGSHCPGQAGAAKCWEPKGLRDLVPMDRQGKLEARPEPAWLLTKRTIQASGSLDSMDTLLLKSRQPKPVCKALSVLGPSFRGKSWAEP